ncbi:MAG: insulinase family protein [Alphaproteobacteria bacterium]|nr:insulinase family protein [Alphaproteobacteria bacterium]MCB9699562.1 insulinase family protein [Alphaproteobacteria bacterium]
MMLVTWLGAAALAQDLPFEQYTLDNGLTVVLHEDHALPQVVVNTWYRVGSKDEVAGRSGFAHLFEHLMFMGTDRLPDNGFDVVMEGHGGWNNAFTFEDGTNYYDVGPAELVDTFLWMEADRMSALGEAMTQEKLDLQRDVVRNERRQNTEDRPYGRVRLYLPQMMYPEGHPYAHSVIGTHEDLMAASLQDVKDFFASWYVPNNAILVVAGDFDPAAVKAAVAHDFGAIPGKPLPERASPEPVTSPTEADRTIEDRVDAARLDLYWHSARALSDDDAKMSLIANLLGGGESSRLYRKLVLTGKAQDVTVFQDGLEWDGTFALRVTALDGTPIEELEAAVREELATLAATPPTDDEMALLRNQLEFGTMYSIQRLQDRALRLAQYAAYTGDPGWLAKDLDRSRRVQAADLSDATRRLLVEGTPVRIVVTPQAEK